MRYVTISGHRVLCTTIKNSIDIKKWSWPLPWGRCLQQRARATRNRYDIVPIASTIKSRVLDWLTLVELTGASGHGLEISLEIMDCLQSIFFPSALVNRPLLTTAMFADWVRSSWHCSRLNVPFLLTTSKPARFFCDTYVVFWSFLGWKVSWCYVSC